MTSPNAGDQQIYRTATKAVLTLLKRDLEPLQREFPDNTSVLGRRVISARAYVSAEEAQTRQVRQDARAVTWPAEGIPSRAALGRTSRRPTMAARSMATQSSLAAEAAHERLRDPAVREAAQHVMHGMMQHNSIWALQAQGRLPSLDRYLNPERAQRSNNSLSADQVQAVLPPQSPASDPQQSREPSPQPERQAPPPVQQAPEPAPRMPSPEPAPQAPVQPWNPQRQRLVVNPPSPPQQTWNQPAQQQVWQPPPQQTWNPQAAPASPARGSEGGTGSPSPQISPLPSPEMRAIAANPGRLPAIDGLSPLSPATGGQLPFGRAAAGLTSTNVPTSAQNSAANRRPAPQPGPTPPSPAPGLAT
ncbi:hypothetical protein [Actinoplanes sp. NPDC051851]|uniref:hypothetical protein n=1 Tax=Actinoplanes sp. NPDC051851 TaxID=3154753 RepID=UPI00344ADF1C